MRTLSWSAFSIASSGESVGNWQVQRWDGARKRWSLRQVESKERCSSSEPWGISGPPSSWIRSLSNRSTSTFLREGVWFRSRMISPPSSQRLSTCRRMVLPERPDEATCWMKSRKQATNLSPLQDGVTRKWRSHVAVVGIPVMCRAGHVHWDCRTRLTVPSPIPSWRAICR